MATVLFVRGRLLPVIGQLLFRPKHRIDPIQLFHYDASVCEFTAVVVGVQRVPNKNTSTGTNYGLMKEC